MTHSANVSIRLFVADACFDCGQIGPNYAYLRNPINLPPQKARALLLVNGREVSNKRVWLVDGMSEGKGLVRFEEVDC